MPPANGYQSLTVNVTKKNSIIVEDEDRDKIMS